MLAEEPVHAENFAPVHSRINWGAIFAGAAIALSLYFLLTLLGSAIGFSIHNKVSSHNLEVSAMVYAIVVTAVCLFIGGYIASQLTTGENKIEGGLYGIIVWATVSGLLIFLMASGVKVGLHAMVGMAMTTENKDWEATARQAGVPQERVDEWKTKANSPETQKAAADAATRTTWWAFFGVWVSMMAAAAGGYFGAVSTPHFFSVLPVRVIRERPIIARG